MSAEEEHVDKKAKVDRFTFCLPDDDAVIWSGTWDELSGDKPFSRITAGGKSWVFKSVNRVGAHLPIGLSLVDEALSLGSTTGVLAATFAIGEEPEPVWLEGALAPIFNAASYYEKEDLLWDVHQQKGMHASNSLGDVCEDGKAKMLDKVTDSSFQRLGLLIIFGRINMLNSNDISLRTNATGGYDLVYADVKKTFHFGIDDDDPPLDEMKEVLREVKCVGRLKQPLTEKMAALVASWSEEAIDAALNAEDKSRAMLREAGGFLMDAGSKYFGRKENNSGVEPWWKQHYKEQAMRLAERVRGGARPSLDEISRRFTKPKKAQK